MIPRIALIVLLVGGCDMKIKVESEEETTPLHRVHFTCPTGKVSCWNMGEEEVECVCRME